MGYQNQDTMAIGKSPTETVLLNAMDNVMPRYFATFILTFGLRPGHSFTHVNDILQRSLDRTSETIPILRGRIFPVAASSQVPSSKGNLEARISKEYSPRVVLNDLSQTWPDYDEIIEIGLRQDVLDGQQLVHKSDIKSVLTADGAPGFLLQANYVNGGLLLAFSFFHSVLDGMGAMLLLKLWAQNARELSGGFCESSRPNLTIQPGSFDRSLLEKIWLDEQKRSDLTSNGASPTQLRLLGLLPAKTSEEESLPEPTHTVMSSKIFYITAESLRNLTKRCAEDSPSTAAPKITANDACMALMWRSTIKARTAVATLSDQEYALDSMSYLDTTLDGRALMSESLPWTYMGTLIFIATTSMSVGDLVEDSSRAVPRASRRIRDAVSSITRQQALEACGVAAGLQNYVTGLRHPFASMRGSEVCISSISNLTPAELTFSEKLFSNAGRPDHVRPPLLEFGTLCRRLLVLPMQPSGGIELLVELPIEEMETLESDIEFCEFAKVCG